MGYIPQHALDNLKKYSYKGVDKSVLSKYVLNPFWNQLVRVWPKSVAPNTITLTGLSLVFINFLTMLVCDPAYLTPKEGAAGPPQWLYFTWAAGLFMYQSLDAIDGKQARRTGMAGPLGEMFDHGCDAINTTLEVILAAYALNLGRSWWTVASQIATLANFYLTTWEEFYTGQLFLGVFSGPVEGILMIVGIYVISGLYGTQVWDTGILTVLRIDRWESIAKILPDMALNEVFMVFGGFGLAFNIITSYTNVYRARQKSGQSPFTPLLHLLPFPTAVALQLLWLSAPSFDNSAILHSSLFVPFLCAWGLQFAHQVGRMILAHVTSTPLPWWDWMWLCNLVGALDANAPQFFGRSPIIQSTPIGRGIFVYLLLAASLATYGRFCSLVISDITNYLGIACFTVRKRDENGVWREAGAIDHPKSS
ncbi:Choline/ethanolaminephosphotransferase [Rickenella mellea]|uniref:diacylglycerol cholinephosphotransferase n=1 Tax=Rickenella mellea TaxID=50990 RepID=A0A4Y7QH55_9AGAM|nr:Choline/ethanolaminephosphotransferase [Rickenella mellea]